MSSRSWSTVLVPQGNHLLAHLQEVKGRFRVLFWRCESPLRGIVKGTLGWWLDLKTVILSVSSALSPSLLYSSPAPSLPVLISLKHTFNFLVRVHVGQNYTLAHKLVFSKYISWSVSINLLEWGCQCWAKNQTITNKHWEQAWDVSIQMYMCWGDFTHER